MHAYRQQGLTLLELMVTIAIAGILLTIGVPSFQAIVTSNRISANTNNFITAINLARSEAIKRGTDISVCKSADGVSCTGDWNQGWIVYLTSDPPEVIIRVFDGLSGDDTLTSSVNEELKFNSMGALASPSDEEVTFNFSLCDSSNERRQIVINPVGRPNSGKVSC